MPDILPMDTVGRLHVMSAGTRVFIKHKRTGGPFAFRLASESVQLLATCMRKRNISVPLTDAAKLIGTESVLLTELTAATQEAVAGMPLGSIICRIPCGDTEIPLLGWLAERSCQLQVPKENKAFVTRVIEKLRLAEQEAAEAAATK